MSVVESSVQSLTDAYDRGLADGVELVLREAVRALPPENPFGRWARDQLCLLQEHRS
jgi:hypothetical protein